MYKLPKYFIIGLIIIILNHLLGNISANLYIFITGEILNNYEIIEVAFRSTYIVIGFLTVCVAIIEHVLKEIEVKYNNK